MWTFSSQFFFLFSSPAVIVYTFSRLCPNVVAAVAARLCVCVFSLRKQAGQGLNRIIWIKAAILEVCDEGKDYRSLWVVKSGVNNS